MKARIACGLTALAAVALCALGLWLWRQGWLTDPTALRQAVARCGPWGPVGIVLAQAAQVLLAPAPGQVVGWMAGYFYGAWRGAALSMVGLMIGTALAIGLARRLGRPLVERWASAEIIARIDAYIERHGALVFFLIFLLPFLPDDACCFVAGLSRVPFRKLMVAAFFGRLPGVWVSTWLGARSQALTAPQIALLAMGGALLALAVWRLHPALERGAVAWLERWSAARRR